MSIRKIQIKKNLEKVIKEFLKNGKNPRIRESIKAAGLDHIGSPNNYSYISGHNQKLDVDKFNKVMDYYEDDLSIINLANQEMIMWTDMCRTNYLGRYNSSQKLYEKIALQVATLAMAIRSGTNSVLAVSESFNSLENIDLSTTTAYIDTANGQVILPIGSTDFVFYSINNGLGLSSVNSSIDGVNWSPAPANDGIEPTFEFVNHRGTLYCKYLLHLTSKKPFLDDEVDVVGIDITIPTYYSIDNNVSVKVSDDKQNWRTLMSPVAGNKMSFIPDDPFEWIEIIVKKNSYDEKHVKDDGSIVYLYLPFLSNVILRAYSYMNSATLQTTDLPISDLASKIGMSSLKFIANDITPGDTTIDYSMRLDSGPWGKIEKNEQVTICPHTIEDDIIYPSSIFKKDNQLYQVGSNCMLSENADLYKGYNQFEHQYCTSSVANLTLSSWINRSNLVSRYLDISENSYFSSQLSHKLYFRIDSERARDFKVSDFSIKKESSLLAVDLSATVYLNRQNLNPKKNNDNTYSFNGTLLEGENYINILIDIPSGTEGGRLHLDGTLFQDGLTYCSRMKQTSFESLSYSIPYTDNNYFAVLPNGELIINSRPYPNARYLYRYIDVNGQMPKSFAIKAELKGNNNSTPVIDDFSVLVLPPIGL